MPQATRIPHPDNRRSLVDCCWRTPEGTLKPHTVESFVWVKNLKSRRNAICERTQQSHTPDWTQPYRDGTNSKRLNRSANAKRIAHGSWLMAHGSWLMAHGSWLMAHGKWQMANGEWRMANGEGLEEPCSKQNVLQAATKLAGRTSTTTARRLTATQRGRPS